MMRLKLAFIIGVLSVLIVSTTLAGEIPVPENHVEAESGTGFKFLRLFPGKNGLLVGRFKLSNDSQSVISVWGKPSAMTEIIALSPSQHENAYATFVKLNEADDENWIAIPKPPNAAPVKAQAYELYPGEIRYLDLPIPNAKNKPKAELVVQLYLQTEQTKRFINSAAFKLSSEE